jgi:hypothetical protein
LSDDRGEYIGLRRGRAEVPPLTKGYVVLLFDRLIILAGTVFGIAAGAVLFAAAHACF